jgi:hypothetical protein
MALRFQTGRGVRPRVKADDLSDQEVDDLYEMANLFPGTTGLPMAVWVSPRGRARLDARVKDSLTPGGWTSDVRVWSALGRVRN